MDNTKTGTLIKELRKEKNMTQKDLAELLHITDRAVSKWERGICAPDISILEPLAEILNTTVTELISGERVKVQPYLAEMEKTTKDVIIYSKNEAAKKARSFRLKAAIACISFCVIVFIAFLSLWHPVIFQRGNPVPYLIAMTKINDTRPYVQVLVDNPNDVFITRRGECLELFDYIEESLNVKFNEQMGSAYIFTTDTDELVVTAEVYFAQYTVWEVPNITLSKGGHRR